MNQTSRAVQKSSKFLSVDLTTGSAVQASAADIWVSSGWIRGFKAVSDSAAPTLNSGTAYAGFAENGGTTPSLVQTITAGDSVVLDIPEGVARNLSELYVLGTTGDKVHIEYFEAYA